jgi:hypothetical protein
MDKRVVYLDLVREHNGSQCCEGRLFADGEFICFTMELPVRSNRKRIDAIPAGEYPVALHPMKSRPSWGPLPLILDVPGRDGIYIHVGNKPKHSKGCILLGLARGAGVLYESNQAVSNLVGMLGGCYCTLTIKEVFN